MLGLIIAIMITRAVGAAYGGDSLCYEDMSACWAEDASGRAVVTVALDNGWLQDTGPNELDFGCVLGLVEAAEKAYPNILIELPEENCIIYSDQTIDTADPVWHDGFTEERGERKWPITGEKILPGVSSVGSFESDSTVVKAGNSIFQSQSGTEQLLRPTRNATGTSIVEQSAAGHVRYVGGRLPRLAVDHCPAFCPAGNGGAILK